jgi:amidase
MTFFTQRLDLGARGGPAVAVKDVIDVAGVATRCGTRALEGAAPAAANAAVVVRLLQAGCRIVGKTVLHELAFGVTGINEWAGTPANTLFPDYIPGGSSSGSAAAVAAGEVDFALGTDTGGSIRVPAACCGVIGFKPTFGRIDRSGVSPAATSLDCIGPIARTMEQISFAMQALDPHFTIVERGGLSVGRLLVGADPAIYRAVDAALRQSGLTVAPVAAPDFAAAFDAGLAIINRETFQAYGHLLGSGQLGEDVARRLAAAARTSDDDVEGAEKVRAAFREAIDRLLDRCDVLALPTLPVVPLLLGAAGADRSAIALTALVRPFNLSGHPALSLPVRTAAGLPAGLQIVARHGDDALLCTAGRHIERALAPAGSEGEYIDA